MLMPCLSGYRDVVYKTDTANLQQLINMILSASQLRALRQRNDEELRKGNYAKHGYPANTIQDLLHTVEALKSEKKKWKKVAQERGELLNKMTGMLEVYNSSK